MAREGSGFVALDIGPRAAADARPLAAERRLVSSSRLDTPMTMAI